MSKTTVLIHGLGNIGRAVIEAVETSPDLEAIGLVRTPSSVGTKTKELRGLPDFPSLAALVEARGLPQVAIICGPSRLVPQDAANYLKAGLNTVDSFDIHDRIPEVLAGLDREARAAGRVAVTAAGWDPGTDSVMRVLFEVMAPVGLTFTNFGRGRSMGHSVAARAVDGVADALALTLPLGGGRHARLVYVLPESGADPAAIRDKMAADPYFAHDSLEVSFIASPAELASVADNSHGVLMERVGASGLSSNQRFSFDMRIDNPALTAQILVGSARAAARLSPGAYTLIDIPPVALLPGEREDHIARLV